MEQTGYELQTLSNDKWVASCIEPDRRRGDLSFSHHQEVADLMPEEQEELLNLAHNDKLNRNDFRRAVRNYKLKLDLPNFTEEQLHSDPEDFKRAQEMVIMLIEVTDEIKNLNWDSLNEDATDYLIAQIRKTVGTLGGVIAKK